MVFIQRVINVRNNLHRDIVDFASLSSFKRTAELVNFNAINCLKVCAEYVMTVFTRCPALHMLCLYFTEGKPGKPRWQILLAFLTSRRSAILGVMFCCFCR